MNRGALGPSSVVRRAARSISMTVRGLPVLPSSSVNLPVKPFAKSPEPHRIQDLGNAGREASRERLLSGCDTCRVSCWGEAAPLASRLLLHCIRLSSRCGPEILCGPAALPVEDPLGLPPSSSDPKLLPDFTIAAFDEIEPVGNERPFGDAVDLQIDGKLAPDVDTMALDETIDSRLDLKQPRT